MVPGCLIRATLNMLSLRLLAISTIGEPAPVDCHLYSIRFSATLSYCSGMGLRHCELDCVLELNLIVVKHRQQSGDTQGSAIAAVRPLCFKSTLRCLSTAVYRLHLLQAFHCASPADRWTSRFYVFVVLRNYSTRELHFICIRGPDIEEFQLTTQLFPWIRYP
jgi:hypothetical protein